MAELYINSLAKTHANWLSVRQSVIASNVANANTPGFRAVDVKPMDDSKSMFTALASTNGQHITAGIGGVDGIGISRQSTWETYHSGSNVSLPQEMMKASEVRGAYELNTTVMKSFHRMVFAVFGN